MRRPTPHATYTYEGYEEHGEWNNVEGVREATIQRGWLERERKGNESKSVMSKRKGESESESKSEESVRVSVQ